MPSHATPALHGSQVYRLGSIVQLVGCFLGREGGGEIPVLTEILAYLARLVYEYCGCCTAVSFMTTLKSGA